MPQLEHLPKNVPIPNRFLRAAREARGWSQEYVAEKLGVTNRTVLRWENGATKPSPRYVYELRRIFSMTAQELGLDFLCADATSQTSFTALAPTLPPHIVGRQADVEAIRRRLLRGESTAITGAPGVGKTTLGQILAYDTALQTHYPHGILWGALGESGSVQEIVSQWGQVLGVSSKQMASTSGEKSRNMLRAAIGERSILLILDDVWEEQIAFTLAQIAGPRCRWLYTSRFRKVAAELVGGQSTYTLGELSTDQGMQVIRQLAPAAVELELQEVESLVKTVGGMPLALRVIGSTLAKQADTGQALQVQKRFEDFNEAREKMHSAIAVSVYALPQETRAALYALSVLQPNQTAFQRRLRWLWLRVTRPSFPCY